MIYPDSLRKSIEYLKKLPGIGEKSAERMALSLIDLPLEDVQTLAKVLVDAKCNLHKCSICNSLTENDICDVCLGVEQGIRDKNVICVLEDAKSVFSFEKARSDNAAYFNGSYHVLDGLISPIDGIGPEDINLASLIRRVEKLDNPEIIIALKASSESEMTTLYIKKIFEGKDVNISRLSYGISIGVDIDYLDELTLFNALNDRKKIS